MERFATDAGEGKRKEKKRKEKKNLELRFERCPSRNRHQDEPLTCPFLKVMHQKMPNAPTYQNNVS
ncbi:hypothetical protein EGH82_06650 [Vibrio ponticus]|uniref:Uncharacterized protein n=1 Tax=Vibrio ponticus TaxID=265668 RepID=A0A3N3E3K6_9VIBR|nr:hypothetical protein EGH82_06650 [Vibrio ponticus]